MKLTTIKCYLELEHAPDLYNQLSVLVLRGQVNRLPHYQTNNCGPGD